MSRVARPLAFSCPHIPLLDQGAKEFLFQQIEEHKPTHIIGLGDWHEADAVNRFGVEYDWQLDYEMEQVAKFMQEIRGLTLDIERYSGPSAELIFMEGNHDWNIRDWKRYGRNLAGLIDYRTHSDPSAEYRLYDELKYWKWFPYENSANGVYRVGQISFSHGFYAGKGADKKMALQTGVVVPYGLYVGGHTHRPTQIQQAHYSTLPLEAYHCNVGTLADIWNGFGYMQKRDRSGWGQGVFVGECELWRYEKSMIPNQKCWEGEVRVRRMFNDGPA